MNLLVKKFGPSTIILLSALIAISCEDPGRIGLIVDSDNGVISTHYQDIILPTSVVQFDPRNTASARSIQAGQYSNNDFGIVTSMSYTQLDLSIVVPPESDAVYASFDVEIKFENFMGESPVNNETQTIGIYQLAEEIDSTLSYNRLDQLAINPTPLGSWQFSPSINDTIQTDSTYIVTLDDAVGQDLFDKLLNGDPIFDSDAAFNAYFKGVAFIPTANNKDIFQINANLLTFRLNYTEFNSDATPIDRTFEMYVGPVGFYYIESDKTGTPLSGISPDNSDFFPADDYRYLQYGTLMALRADLTPFYLLTDTLKNLIINKAEIYLGQVKNYGDDLPPPPFLQVYFTDETNEWPVVDNIGRFDSTQVGVNFIMLQDESRLSPPGVYTSPLSTFINEEAFNYRFNMSVFFQDLFSGNYSSPSEPFLEEKGQIFIFGETNVLFPQTSTSHLFTSPMAIHKDSVRLRIYYTIPTNQNQ